MQSAFNFLLQEKYIKPGILTYLEFLKIVFRSNTFELIKQ